MSVRSSRKKLEGANAPKEQLKEYAFTIKGHIMHDPYPHDTAEIISCYSKQASPFRDVIKQSLLRTPEEQQDHPVFRPDNDFTPRELAKLEIGLKKYVIVGYASRHKIEHLNVQSKGSHVKKQKPLGVELPDDPALIHRWDDKEPPCYVVAEIINRKPYSIQLWCLLNPSNQLCTPYTIGQDEVFYRHEFRDSTTNIKDRGPNWNKKVEFHIVRPGEEDTPLTEKQARFKHARENIKLVFNPNVSVANEVAFLAKGYERKKDIWFIREIQSILKSIDGDLNFRPLKENRGLRKFIEEEEEMDEESSELVLQDLTALWPSLNVESVSAKQVQKLHEALWKTKTRLPYRFIRPFFAEITYLMQTKDKLDLEKAVVKVIASAQRMLGEPEEAPPVEGAGHIDCLNLMLLKLKEIQAASKDANAQMKDAYGEVVFGDVTAHDIWAHFADASDTDTARAAFNHQCRMMVAEFQQKEKGLGGMIDDLIEAFEKFI